MPLFLCAMLDQVDQKTSSDDIYSCRDHIRRCQHRLLLEFFDTHGVVHLQYSKSAGIIARIEFLADNRNICLLLNMIFQHLIIIHLIYGVPGCNDHVRLMAFLQKIQILIDRVRRTSVPISVVCRYRRGKYIQPPLLSSEIPPFGGIQVFVQ